MFNLDKLINFGVYIVNWFKIKINKQTKEKVWYEIKYEDYLNIKTVKIWAASEEEALFDLFNYLDWYIPEIKSIEVAEEVTLFTMVGLKTLCTDSFKEEPGYKTTRII